MHDRIIFHIDVNSAFLSWDAAYRLKNGEKQDLRLIPSAVGGDVSKRHGIIYAKSIPAKKYNIHTGEPVIRALEKCPCLTLIPPDYALYEHCSKQLMALLSEYSSHLEQLSIDEAFLDMTSTCHLYGAPLETADLIRNRIRTELGFTVNIGVSSNKLLAKMASDFKKPDYTHTLFPEEIRKKMWPLPIRKLYSVGRATEEKLHSLGILTIGELAETDKSILYSHLKKQGEVIHCYANGLDDSPLQEEIENKGYSNSVTVPFDIHDPETAKLFLLSLCETVGYRLRLHHSMACIIAVEITDCNFIHSSHQQTLSIPTDVTTELYHASCRLFDELWDSRTPIRLIGVRTNIATEYDGQYSFFEPEGHKKLARLDRSIDQIREKYGTDSVIRASFLESSISPMSGRHRK